MHVPTSRLRQKELVLDLAVCILSMDNADAGGDRVRILASISYLALMASNRLCFSPSLLPILFPSSLPTQNPLSYATLSFTPTLPTPSSLSSFSNHPSVRRKKQQSHAAGENLLGDFGARDPFPAEIESGFAEKVLGNVDTEHRILIPNLSALSLCQQKCTPISPSQTPMTEDEAKSLLRKVVGWRLVESEGGLRLQCLWRLRDFGCGVELINRIYKGTEDVGHYPDLHLEQPNQVRAVLWTASIGGLSTNDFIVAAKIDEVKTSDLVPKKRVWA